MPPSPSPRDLIQFGVSRLGAGRPAEAAGLFRQALERAPSDVVALNGLGIALTQDGRAEEALSWFDLAIKAHPRFPPAHTNRGLALQQLGRWDEAAACHRRALKLDPNYPQAHTNLGAVLAEWGRHRDAERHHRRAVALNPRLVEAQTNLGNALFHLGRDDEAMACHRRALQVAPRYVVALANLGCSLNRVGRSDEAERCFRQALAETPGYSTALVGLGETLGKMGDGVGAAACYREALDRDPDLWTASLGLALCLIREARPQEAAVCLEEAIARNPQKVCLFQLLLAAATYRDDLDAAALAALHQRFGESVAASDMPLPAVPAAGSDGRLRIGYLSADLINHPVARNLLPALRHHDHASVSIHIYADIACPDAVTAEAKTMADRWHDIAGMTDAEVADLIRSENLDILISLAGRFDRNRPAVCARRVAPVQISLHDVATSGLATMDYIVGDRWLCPRGSEETFTERPLRLPHFYIADFPSDLPDLPDRRGAGPAVFCCFNNPAKITPSVLRTWGAILAAAPETRLVLKYFNAYGDRALCTRFATALQEAGADAGQIDFVAGTDSRHTLLERYGTVDIALDTFPFSGSTTSFQALAMGMPIITWPWERMVSRWTLALLAPLGLADTVADSADAYVARAIAAAKAVESWRGRRAEIRGTLAESRLCDGRGWVRHFERLCRAVSRRARV